MASLQVQLEQLELHCGNLRPSGDGDWNRQVRVPKSKSRYVKGVSSKGKEVVVPRWVEIDGVRFEKLEAIPNASQPVGHHAGAHGCVAAYEVIRADKRNCKALGIPTRLAVKCVLFGSEKVDEMGSARPWMQEWRIHKFLYQKGPQVRDSVVKFVGGVSAMVSGVPYVFCVMELLDTDLFTAVERANKMPEFGTWILRCMYSTACALRELHQSGVTYCDLKPENVLVDIKTGKAKFGDFDRSCVPSLRVGVVGGTRGYYSPERMRSSSTYSAADDVWAFGVLLLIGSTCAASPFLDYNHNTVHRFRVDKYLRKYTKCNWDDTVMDKIVNLAENLLMVDAKLRCGLNFAIDVLRDILVNDLGVGKDELPNNFYPPQESITWNTFKHVQTCFSQPSTGTSLPSPQHMKRWDPLLTMTSSSSSSTTPPSPEGAIQFFIPNFQRAMPIIAPMEACGLAWYTIDPAPIQAPSISAKRSHPEDELLERPCAKRANLM